MKKTIILLTALLQSVFVSAQTTGSLKSPSELLNAEIDVKDQSVQIFFFY